MFENEMEAPKGPLSDRKLIAIGIVGLVFDCRMQN